MTEEWKRPPDGFRYGWREFVRLAMREGIGSDPDDYMPWWEFWKAGYMVAEEKMRKFLEENHERKNNKSV